MTVAWQPWWLSDPSSSSSFFSVLQVCGDELIEVLGGDSCEVLHQGLCALEERKWHGAFCGGFVQTLHQGRIWPVRTNLLRVC